MPHEQMDRLASPAQRNRACHPAHAKSSIKRIRQRVQELFRWTRLTLPCPPLGCAANKDGWRGPFPYLGRRRLCSRCAALGLAAPQPRNPPAATRSARRPARKGPRRSRRLCPRGKRERERHHEREAGDLGNFLSLCGFLLVSLPPRRAFSPSPSPILPSQRTEGAGVSPPSGRPRRRQSH